MNTNAHAVVEADITQTMVSHINTTRSHETRSHETHSHETWQRPYLYRSPQLPWISPPPCDLSSLCVGAPSRMSLVIIFCISYNPVKACCPEKLCHASIKRAGHLPLTSRCACGLSSTVLARVLDSHMMADDRATAELASASLAAVLADRGTASALSLASLAAVLKHGGAATELA